MFASLLQIIKNQSFFFFVPKKFLLDLKLYFSMGNNRILLRTQYVIAAWLPFQVDGKSQKDAITSESETAARGPGIQ